MQKILVISILILLIAISTQQGFRPPAVPLIVQDPYTSIWSAATNLTDSWSTHWTGQINALVGMVNIDGSCYRFMGPSDMSGSVCPNPLQQMNVVVNATSTYYTFAGAGIQLTVQFMTPSILDDFDLLALPQSYIKYTVINTDNTDHVVKLYYDNSAEVAVSQQSEQVDWYQNVDGNLTILKIGTQAQQFNGDNGSDRIDWGYWYVAAKYSDQYTLSTTVNSDVNSRGAFAKNEILPSFDTNMPRACGDNWPVLSILFDFGKLSSNQQVESMVSIAYDEVYSIEYFGSKFKRYWTQLYESIPNLFQQTFANETYVEELFTKCNEFDNEIYNQLFSAGNNNNQNYSLIGSLAYRQVTGGIILVWNDVLNTTWAFMKEISSDGDVSTVDVIFPSSPLFFVKNPEVFRLILLPLLAYANNETQIYGAGINYNLTWAPHHLGHWPVCDIEPMQQEQMPIEETGNLLILITFIAQAQQNIDYLEPYWPLLDQYGQYLIDNLPDPGNQLCTDDFEGPSPHNANLAAKGIVAIAAYSKLLEMKNKGSTTESQSYMSVAQNYSSYWQQFDFDQNHYELEYNDTNTWSQKYNLLFDIILGTNVFPSSVITTELAYYITQLQQYGIPLDNRSLYTKLDWSFWSAAMGTNEQFQILTNAIFNFANSTPNRVPLTDWYFTNNAQQAGFQARPVVGGVFAKVLIEMKSQSQKQQLVQE